MTRPPNESSLPVAESCLRNQLPIYEALSGYLRGARTVLEIGSGTGQHAVFMADRLPELCWHPSDLLESLPGINRWVAMARNKNVRPAFALDVAAELPEQKHAQYSDVFTANTVHFVSETLASNILLRAAEALMMGGQLFIYGPFNYCVEEAGEKHEIYTSEGNQRLDAWLKSRDPASGIKSTEWLVERARGCNMNHVGELSLPANNLIHIFQKGA